MRVITKNNATKIISVDCNIFISYDTIIAVWDGTNRKYYINECMFASSRTISRHFKYFFSVGFKDFLTKYTNVEIKHQDFINYLNILIYNK